MSFTHFATSGQYFTILDRAIHFRWWYSKFSLSLPAKNCVVMCSRIFVKCTPIISVYFGLMIKWDNSDTIKSTSFGCNFCDKRIKH